MQDHSSKALQRARKLRSTISLPEVLLWNRLRGNPMGVKFRKQHPLGDYVIDFFRASKRIAVEIDGIAHDRGNRPMRDSSRDAWLRRQGVEVLRIPAAEVLRDVAAVADAVVRYCADPPPPSAAGAAATSPGGEDFSE